MVSSAYNHRRQRSGGSWFRANPEEKSVRLHLNKQAVHVYNSSYVGGIGRRIAVWDWPDQNHENLPEK
jgi:hypothetical protein